MKAIHDLPLKTTLLIKVKDLIKKYNVHRFEFSTSLLSILPKLIYTFNTNSIKTPAVFLNKLTD